MEIAIVAHGECPVVRRTDRSETDMAAEVLGQVLARTGLDRREIDGLATGFGPGERFWSNSLAEALGLRPGWLQVTDLGGASSIANVQRAAAAIAVGQCSVAFCVAASKAGPPAVESEVQRDYLAPFGHRGPVTAFGLISDAYNRRHGLDPRALARLAVTQRNNALVNENACKTLRKPLSEADYLASRMVANPLRLLDCVMPCAGANGVLVMSVERARALGIEKMARILSYAEISNFHRDSALPDPTVSGFSVAGPQALERAGMRPSDIRMLQAYDDFLIAVLLQLEDIGFCRKGGGSAFLRNTDLSPTGTLPVNTGGGMISCGQPSLAGGGIALVEAVRQLLCEGGARQVPDPRNAMVTGIGVIPYTGNWGTSAVLILEAMA